MLNKRTRVKGGLSLLFIYPIWAFGLECANPSYSSQLGTEQLKTDLEILASDDFAGRRAGTKGAKMARDYLAKRYREIGLAKIKPIRQTTDEIAQEEGLDNHYFHLFSMNGLFNDKYGINVVGLKRGTEFPDRYIVITAHYDHLGKKGGKTFNGADDNASGVAGMLSVAERLQSKPTRYSFVFLATDFEEAGLYGAKAFVENPPIPRENIELNVNLDMISQPGRRNKLFVAGTKNNEQLKALLAQVQTEAGLCLVAGHDGRTKSRFTPDYIDWRRASDHWAFVRRDIPYLFVSVDEHRFYHKASDTFENVPLDFYYSAVDSVHLLIEQVDLLAL